MEISIILRPFGQTVLGIGLGLSHVYFCATYCRFYTMGIRSATQRFLYIFLALVNFAMIFVFRE